MEEKLLDFILVPSGLLVLLSYHLWLRRRIINNPTKTVVGVNTINRRLWVREMMEDVSKNGVLAVQSLRINIMASVFVASMAIMMSSFLAVTVWMSYSGVVEQRQVMIMLYGNRSQQCLSIKFFAILVCFMVAFLMNVQSIRYYSHASILINVPFKKECPNIEHQMLTSDYVAAAFSRGSHFWSLGVLALYFSFPMFMWLFGPILMFVSCFALVFTFYFLDVTEEYGWPDQNRTRDVEAAAEIISSSN